MTDVVARLDDWGRPAWIALMVAGFILFWPVGLAVLAFLLWSGRMGGCGRHGGWGGDPRQRWERQVARLQDRIERWGKRPPGSGGGRFTPSGNRAFDEYREETLRRLEDEAQEFTQFLDRLRQAKDKAEFEQFMAERRTAPPQSSNGTSNGV